MKIKVHSQDTRKRLLFWRMGTSYKPRSVPRVSEAPLRRSAAFFRDAGVKKSMDVLYLIGVVAAWFVLMKWVLPRFGVGT